jgi:hypothetical protein
MTAAVWLAPMLPKLPLPLAQRLHRLLGARPGRDTEEHALRLCEAMIAYAACMRAGYAAALLPAGKRRTLAAGVAEFRRVVQAGDAKVANYRDLLLVAAEAIDEAEPGHPLGRIELARPRTSWVARMQLVEALDESVEVSDSIKTQAVDGGVEGIVALWIRLIESRRASKREVSEFPWLGPLGDLLVDTLGSSLVGEATLVYPERAATGGLAGVRRLHGLESELEDGGDLPGNPTPGVIGWRFDDRMVSSCGLLGYWVDEHELEHVGVLVKQIAATEYLDYGSGQRSPSKQSSSDVDWSRLHADQAKSTAVTRKRTPLIAAAIVGALILVVGVSLALRSGTDRVTADSLASSELERSRDPSLILAGAQESESPPQRALDDDEIVIEGPKPEPEEPEVGGPRLASEVNDQLDAPTASLWFESERNLGICQITYDGRTRAANLHLKTRQAEGTLEFTYRCGQHRGRGSIDVKRNRVNGVLFCKKDGSVKVKVVRSNEGRCDR